MSGNGLAKPKLLGSPIIPNATGVAQRDAVIALLVSWNIRNIIGLVFYTTASNTGCLKGTATLIELWLNFAILWLA